MKCQFCSNAKMYELTEVEDNKAKVSYSLCQNCLASYIKDKNSLSVSPKINIDPKDADKFVQEMMDFVEKALEGIFSPKPPQVEALPKFKKTQKSPCPKCNTSMEDIIKMGKLGCPNCYDWYAEELQQTLYHHHSTPDSPENLIHTGKRPKKHPPSQVTDKNETDKMRSIKLQYKLSQAIQKEDYETAAKLRDIIKDLKED